jgi:hypothetical protein
MSVTGRRHYNSQYLQLPFKSVLFEQLDAAIEMLVLGAMTV